jgi:hypothetical protein
MLKGLAGVAFAAVIFAAVIYLILHLLGFIGIILGMLAVFGILALLLIFIGLFIFGFVLFFALFYYLFEKKPSIQTTGNYTLSMEKGKHEEKMKNQ